MSRVDVLTSSKNQNWITPPEIFDPLNEEFGFQWDAAANTKSCKVYSQAITGLHTELTFKKYFGPDHCNKDLRDALAIDWKQWTKGPIWLNSPYGHGVGKWVEKAYEESKNGLTVVMLIYARTETKWFHEYVMKADEVRFCDKRIKFLDPGTMEPATSGATAGHMIVVFRPHWEGPPRFGVHHV